ADVDRISPHVDRRFWRLWVRSSIPNAGSLTIDCPRTFSKKLVAGVPYFSQQRVKHLVPHTAAIEHCSRRQHDSVGEGVPITACRFSCPGIAQGLSRLEPGDRTERARQP